jgi:asparagine synthase (glutamine-hydrolysing)
MCGIAGLVEPTSHQSHDGLAAAARLMADALTHRGPDDSGTWADAEAGVALGHRRLSILDLTQAGHQPMTSASGRWVMTYNGEVYNHAALRQKLARRGYRFTGGSDTEVVLGGLDVWGLDATLRECNGMFALAAWDRRDRVVHLVRDRLGEKPLYFGWSSSGLLFGSELKALLAHRGFAPRIDRSSLALYLRHNCVPAPFCIYEGVQKVMPGQVVSVRVEDVPLRRVQRRTYWSARDVAERGGDAPRRSDDDVVEELRALFLDAVRLRMVADVPVGAFLSGGVDSSLVAALMVQASDAPVRTFTVGFSDPAYDESADAAAVAARLGTLHTDVRLHPDQAMAAIPRLPDIYDEPFADSSQLPTLLVSRLAGREITVALTGDGADELFAGYNRHAWCERLWGRLEGLPLRGRRAVGAALALPSPGAVDWVARVGSRGLPAQWRLRTPSTKVAKLARILPSFSPEDMYQRLTSHWHDPSALVGVPEPTTLASDTSRWPALPTATERLMLLDQATYLPDDILTKVDRASMSVGLEVRVPFLDHRIVEAAWRLPLSQKLRDGQTKWPLRQMLRAHLPDEMVNRPKMGFGLPLGSWLRAPLRDWAEDLLSAAALADDGLLEPEPIRRLWHAHVRGRVDASQELWDVLMFQAWRRRPPDVPVQERPAQESASTASRP